jgi:hypothetical protein
MTKSLHGRTKNPIKISGQNHHGKDKKEGQRKAKIRTTKRNQRREKVSPSHGRKLSHPQPL